MYDTVEAVNLEEEELRPPHKPDRKKRNTF